MIKVLILFFILVINITASTVTLTVEENSFIKNHPTITLAGGASFEPFLIQNQDGTISGYDVDIVNLIKEKTGLNIKFKLASWQKIQEAAKERSFDGLSTTSISGDRDKYYNFSHSYFKYTPLVILNKGNPKNIYKHKDLEGKRVAIQKGNLGFIDIAKSIKNVKIIYYERMHDLIKALVSKEVDFSIIDETAFYIAKEIGLESFIEHSFTIGETTEIVFCLRNDYPELHSIVNKALNSISKQEYINIRDKWFGSRMIEKQLTEINFTPQEQEYLNKKKIINVCVDPDWLPYSKMINGRHVGISAEYLQVLAKRLPIPLHLVKTKDWNETLEFARTRKCDIVDFATDTPSRRKYLDFTSTVVSLPLILVTKHDVPFIDNLNILQDKKIAIPKGYAYIELLKEKYPFLNIREVNTIDDGLQAVKDGKVYGYIGALASVAHSFKNNFTGELKVTAKLDFPLAIGSGIRNDDKELFKIIQQAINSIPQVEIENIVTKWINIKYEVKTDYTLVRNIVIALVLIILLFLYRQFVLKKANSKLEYLVIEKTQEIQKINENLELKIVEEVEKSKMIEKKLFEVEKLASMGEMIGNIAHQWRQPLNVISIGVGAMRVSHELDDLSDREFIETCELIDKNAQYLSKTIDDFRKYLNSDRKQALFSLKGEIDSVKHLVESSLNTHYISLIIDLESDIEVYGYENELTQCLINIINNAQDALLEREEENRYVFISATTQDNSVVLSVKDNAGGIAQGIIDKVFEPYFTTKHKSQGTGLGLHMTYKLIVDGMGGTIDVENVDYKYNDLDFEGAEFIITLPLSNLK